MIRRDLGDLKSKEKGKLTHVSWQGFSALLMCHPFLVVESEGVPSVPVSVVGPTAPPDPILVLSLSWLFCRWWLWKQGFGQFFCV